ncbi:MAG: hypothetical protein UHM85_01570 [Acutalibacteraceae bacterium]|nr:hypothetical protein [Acutalibacteraceae bacterium]
MLPKRVSLFAGHYGSGKTNIAVNYAKQLKKQNLPVVIADLDIVNPYFRTKDSEKELKELGIDLICSEFANTNLDIPSLPQSMYRVIHDKSIYAVMDIGGDDAGAVALGRFAPSLMSENAYDMFFVVNFYRPLTKNAQDAFVVLKEIEAASGMKFTGIINNSNLGSLTKAEDVLSTEAEVKKLCDMSGLPLVFTSAEERVCEEIGGRAEKLFPLVLQSKLF